MDDFDKIAKLLDDRDAVLTARAYAMGKADADARLRCRVETLEGRIAWLLRWSRVGGVWSSRRTGGKR